MSLTADRSAELDDAAVGSTHTGDGLAPWFTWFADSCSTRSDSIGYCRRNVFHNERDLNASRFGEVRELCVAVWEVQIAKCVGRKNKRRFAGVEFRIVAAFMEEASQLKFC